MPLPDRETTTLPTRGSGHQEWDTGLGSHVSQQHKGLLRDSALRWLQGSALAGLSMKTTSEGSFLLCRAEKACQITWHVPEYSLEYLSSCFPVGVLPLHVSRPPGRAVQNKSSAPVATTTLPAAFQAIFHPLAQQYYSKRAQIIFPVNI